jgi:DNA-binding XRE family transcriptional regulator
MITTGHWIRQMREDAGLSQEQLAVMIGISSSTVRKWEKDQVTPSLSIHQWQAFAEAVKVPFSDLPTTIPRIA